ncbi:MAG TPA: hypothetical protein VJ836_04185 [Candidatus Saccharimonadales bacterium]|nr:hypothetical protein [Candidatus Saccharimonadales bacterium]
MNRHTDWYIELYPSLIAIDVTDHIMNHLAQRITIGNAIIICEYPARLQAPHSKLWKKTIRICERVFASTLNARLRKELSDKIAILEHTKFVVWPVSQQTVESADRLTVWLVPPDTAIGTFPPDCVTLYITVPVTGTQMAEYMRALPPKSTLVVYRGGRTVTMAQLPSDPNNSQ